MAQGCQSSRGRTARGFTQENSSPIRTTLVQMARSDRLRWRAEQGEVGNGQAKDCRRAFKGRQFDRGVVILCVRWYLLFADSAYAGDKLLNMLTKFGNWTIKIVRRMANAVGF